MHVIENHCKYEMTFQTSFATELTQHTFFCQVWINTGDIILLGLRDYQDTKADVILRYNTDEARNLKSYGELPETGRCLRGCL